MTSFEILSIVFVIGIAIIWWIVKFFLNRNEAKKAEAEALRFAMEPARVRALS